MHPRPNYAEPEEWEVEDPNYPSNTTYRKSDELSDSDRAKYSTEVSRCKEAVDRAASTLPKTQRHCAVIDIFRICQGMEIYLPMSPKFRASVRNKIREFETQLRVDNCPMDPRLKLSLQEAMDVTKKALANAHCSPFYVAAR